MTISSPSQRIRSFYDGFANKLLADYWGGNARVNAAIRHALGWIPPDVGRVLDIGCGIGWSTREIARHRPGAEVVALDVSPGLLEVARELTDAENARYEVRDFTASAQQAGEPFDAVVMLDVYEHFPAGSRGEVHAALKGLMAEDSVAILTFPTPRHQAYLRLHEPDGLQPVDADVTHDDVARLAGDVGGEVVCCNNVTIWRTDDYTHAAIARGKVPRLAQKGGRAARITLETTAARRARVRAKLGVRVLEGEIVLPVVRGPALCIACFELGVYSETFIKDHVTRLPMPVRVLHGKPPHFDDEGRDLFRGTLPRRILDRFRQYLLKTHPYQLRVEALTRFLRCNNVAAVMAEYGPNGVDVMEPCRWAGVPLVVHFHGFDAYVRQCLDQYQQQYAEMFQYAAAIVAVSRDMQRQLVELGAPEEKVVWIPCGVDVAIFDQAAPDEAPPSFVAVGRFVEKKGPHLTLLAFQNTLRACPEASLTMIGDGPLLGPCRHLAKALGISQAVEFTGVRGHGSVRATMQEARAFVQHSVRASDGDSEGTPLAVTEAQAAGLPVVATAHAGIKDVVVDGQTGILVAEGDVDAMAAGMIALAAAPDQAARLGQAGRKRVLENFTLEHSIKKLTAVIEKASNGRIPRYDNPL